MGIFFCCMAILCFSGLYLAVGQTARRSIDAMGLNCAAFGAGALLSMAAALPVAAAQFPPRVVAVGAGIGVAAALGLLATTLAVRAGIALSLVTTTVTLALTVPVLLSFVFYGEAPTPRKWAGLGLAALSIVLIQGRRR